MLHAHSPQHFGDSSIASDINCYYIIKRYQSIYSKLQTLWLCSLTHSSTLSQQQQQQHKNQQAQDPCALWCAVLDGAPQVHCPPVGARAYTALPSWSWLRGDWDDGCGGGGGGHDRSNLGRPYAIPHIGVFHLLRLRCCATQWLKFAKPIAIAADVAILLFTIYNIYIFILARRFVARCCWVSSVFGMELYIYIYIHMGLWILQICIDFCPQSIYWLEMSFRFVQAQTFIVLESHRAPCLYRK